MTFFQKLRSQINHDGNAAVWLALLLVGVFLGAGAMRLRQPPESPPVQVQTIYLAKDRGKVRPPAPVAVRKEEVVTPAQPAGRDLVVIVSQPGKKHVQASSSKKQWSEENEFGITIRDVQHIAACFDNIADVAIVRDLKKTVLGKDGTSEVKLFAVTPAFLDVTHGTLKGERGRWFSHVDMETRAHVCVLGTQAATKLFGLQDPVGKEVTIGEVGFKVIGIVENTQGKKAGDSLMTEIALIPLDTANAAFGSRVAVASSTRWRKLYARIECDYLLVRVANVAQIDNTINRLRSYFQATHEAEDYEIMSPQ